MLHAKMTHPGGPEVLQISEIERPTLKAGEILVRVRAAGVNRPDLMQRMGKYPPPPGASPILGLEVAGVIEEIGTGVSAEWKVGDAVCALTPGGGYAEFCAVPAVQCLLIPQGLSMVEAAGLPETFFTVWANVFQIGGLRAGETFLVHGGSSGIGTTAIQLARAFGGEVFATAGSDAKCAACEKLGAKLAVNYKTQDFVTEVRRATGDRGVDLILDMVGGSYTPRNIDVLAVGGRLVQIATQQGADVQINLMKMMQKRVRITGSTLRPRSVEEKGLMARELREQVWPKLAAREVRVQIDRVFPFAEVAEAHRYLEEGQHVGKIILSFDVGASTV